MKKLILNCKTGKSEQRDFTQEEAAAIDQANALIEENPYEEEAKAAILAQFPIDKQLDAIWEQFNQMRLQKQPLIQQADDMLNGIQGVKRKIKNRHKSKNKQPTEGEQNETI